MGTALRDQNNSQKARQEHHENLGALKASGVLALLRPLLFDPVVAIQQTATLTLGHLANYSSDLAEAVVSIGALPQLVDALQSQEDRLLKRFSAFVLRAIAQHERWAQKVVECGALDALVSGLEDSSPPVREESARALEQLVKHNKELAGTAVDAGVLPLLTICLQEREPSLQFAAAAAVCQVCRHSYELSMQVLDADCLPLLANEVRATSPQLRRVAMESLSWMMKHSPETAQRIHLEKPDLLETLLHCLSTDPDRSAKKAAATCLREFCGHTEELAKICVNEDGLRHTIPYISEARGNDRLPAIMMLGYIASFSETLALAIIVSKGIAPLKDALINEGEDHLKTAAAWSLGNIGLHSHEHARCLADEDVLRRLLAVHLDPHASTCLKDRSEASLISVIKVCNYPEGLQPLLLERTTPLSIITVVVERFALILNQDTETRRAFVQSGGIQRLQELKEQADPAGDLFMHIEDVNSLYPEDLILYYTPGYARDLLMGLNASAGHPMHSGGY
jgi:HEAT repeat protein